MRFLLPALTACTGGEYSLTYATCFVRQFLRLNFDPLNVISQKAVVYKNATMGLKEKLMQLNSAFTSMVIILFLILGNFYTWLENVFLAYIPPFMSLTSES